MGGDEEEETDSLKSCFVYLIFYHINLTFETVPYKTYFDYVVNKRLRCDELDSCSCLFPTMPRSTHWRRALIDMVLHMFIISFIFPTHPASLPLPTCQKLIF